MSPITWTYNANRDRRCTHDISRNKVNSLSDSTTHWYTAVVPKIGRSIHGLNLSNFDVLYNTALSDRLCPSKYLRHPSIYLVSSKDHWLGSAPRNIFTVHTGGRYMQQFPPITRHGLRSENVNVCNTYTKILHARERSTDNRPSRSCGTGHAVPRMQRTTRTFRHTKDTNVFGLSLSLSARGDTETHIQHPGGPANPAPRSAPGTPPCFLPL